MTGQRRVDARLAIPAAGCWLAAALLVGASPRAAAWVAGVAVVAAGMAAGARRLVVVALCLGVAAGAATVALHVHALRSSEVARLAGSSTASSLDLTLTRDPVELSRNGRRFVIAAATVASVDGRADRAPVTLLAHGGGWLELLPGQRLRVEARLRPPRPGDAVAATALVRGRPQLIGRPPLWQRWAGDVRSALRRAVTSLPPDERGLVPGLVIGDVSAMPPDLTAAFRASGLTHLNAVSGENVVVVLATVAALVRRTSLGRQTRGLVSLAALGGFVILARPSPSVLRAAVMGAVVVIGGLVGRRAQPLPALAAAVLGLIVVDPFLARTPGFAMSVLATAAIVLAARPVAARLGRVMPRPVAVALAVPTVAQIACTPVLVVAFGQIGVWAVPANVVAGVAVAPATVVGVLCAVSAVPLPGIASALAWIAAVPAAWLAGVARVFAALPGAGLALPSRVAPVYVTAAAAAALVLLAVVIRRRRLHAMLGAWPP